MTFWGGRDRHIVRKIPYLPAILAYSYYLQVFETPRGTNSQGYLPAILAFSYYLLVFETPRGTNSQGYLPAILAFSYYLLVFELVPPGVPTPRGTSLLF